MPSPNRRGRTLHNYPRRTVQTALLTLLLAHPALADVTWLSPSAGDIYGPADTLVAKWTADKDITSPSFRLCLAKGGHGDDNGGDGDSENDGIESRSDDGLESRGSDIGGCGSQTWPDVTRSGGASMMSMAVPSVTADHPYYLSMEDDYGTRSRSPTFSLSKSAPASPNPPPAAPAALNNAEDPAQAQAPFAATSTPSLVAASSAPVASLAPPPPSSPEVLSSRTPVPTAAFAVPISIVGAILLIAIYLGFRQRSALRKARQRDAEKLSRQTSASSFGSSTTLPGDLATALAALKQASPASSCHGHPQVAVPHSYGCGMPVPLYAAPVEVMREPRRPTRQEYRPPSLNREYSRRDEYAASWLGSQSLSRSSTRDSYHPSSRQVYGGYRSSSSREPHYQPSHAPRSSRSSEHREHRPSSRSSRDYYPSMDHMLHPQYTRTSPSRSSTRASELPAEHRRHHPPSRRSTIRSDASGETAVTESVLADYADFEEVDRDEYRRERRQREDRHHRSRTPSCLLPAPQRLHIRTEGPDLATSPGIERYLFLEKDLPG
ncbi:uncharacterized protein SCHCODRAFT_02609137 [Schizophyllum commune H4-8]|uniref:uncharacterized protein n=1 Tax=Schizophyllum commune (strain H4-8 / FGSC 9210) TaxID=578458 RepID=UPI00215E015D|nr:uncharacterized protein SCHCODRAFT_02609137 [Schizophyllum commune H4-8]KAI5897352.1 hypothetical protein SCHCODRAFT_02609137 [Schizophyllum commune H4-8]